MPIPMPDSVRVASLPPGYPAYLGYCDGLYPTSADLSKAFPAALKIILTVTGNTLGCDGCDVEHGDVTISRMSDWLSDKLAHQPNFRPVIYADVSTMRDYVLPELGDVGRTLVRLLTAHWGDQEHICGPGTCGEISIDMDGTQWTASYETTELYIVDMSTLRDDFFGLAGTEAWVQQLPVVKLGDEGKAVRTVQGLCAARGFDLNALDGIFGPKTAIAVRGVQGVGGVAQDGVVGPQTWPVLLGIT